MFAFTDTKALSEEGAWVHLKDRKKPAYLAGEDGKPDKTKPIRIRVLGPHSPTLQEKKRKRAAKRISDQDGNVDLTKMSQVEIEAFLESNENAAAENWTDATIGWENMPTFDGKSVLNFSPANAEKLYLTYPSIVEQLHHDAGDIDDFLALVEQD